MPSWCENKITITAETEGEMAAFLDAVSGRNYPFDVRAICPVPAILYHLGCSESGFFEFHVHGKIVTVPVWFDRRDEHGEVIERRPFTPAELMTYQNQPYANELDWRMSNWGGEAEPWEVELRRMGKLTYISFRTNDGPPKGIIDTLRKRFPELSITVSFDIFDLREKGSY